LHCEAKEQAVFCGVSIAQVLVAFAQLKRKAQVFVTLTKFGSGFVAEVQFWPTGTNGFPAKGQIACWAKL